MNKSLSIKKWSLWLIAVSAILVLCNGCADYKKLQFSDFSINPGKVSLENYNINSQIVLKCTVLNPTGSSFTLGEGHATVVKKDKTIATFHTEEGTNVVIPANFNDKLELPMVMTLDNPLSLLSILDINNSFLVNYDMVVQSGIMKTKVSGKDIQMKELLRKLELK